MEIEKYMRVPVITINAEETVHRAMYLMQKNHIRHLPVMEIDTMVGIVSSRDVRSAIDTISEMETDDVFRLTKHSIKEIMTTRVLVVHPETRVQECARLMSEKKIGCVPVVKKGEMKVLGIITETDMLRIFARLVDQLEKEGKL